MDRIPDRRVADAMDEMERRIGEPIRVGELAASVNLSASRFAHLFREHTGSSPMRYLRDLRLERARLLLERTSLSIADIMRLVGCLDPSHFAKDFRRRFGSAPRDYRREANDRPLNRPA
jgi:AraC family transcriptional regulator of arabinose operon